MMRNKFVLLFTVMMITVFCAQAFSPPIDVAIDQKTSINGDNLFLDNLLTAQLDQVPVPVVVLDNDVQVMVIVLIDELVGDDNARTYSFNSNLFFFDGLRSIDESTRQNCTLSSAVTWNPERIEDGFGIAVASHTSAAGKYLIVEGPAVEPTVVLLEFTQSQLPSATPGCTPPFNSGRVSDQRPISAVTA